MSRSPWGRDRGVAFDQAGGDAAEGLDAEGQRGDVEQDHVAEAGVAAEHAALDGSAGRHDFVRVHALVRILAEDLLGDFLDAGHTGHAADEDDLVDLGAAETGVVQAVVARDLGAFEQRVGELFELGAGERHLEVHRAVGVHADERQVDVGAHAGGEFDLGLHDDLVEVVAAQVRVAVGGLHFEDAVADFEDGDIERAAAEVVHRDALVGFLLIHAVGQCGRGRLVDDALDVKTGDAAGVLGGLTLRVVEVGRDGDDVVVRDHFIRYAGDLFLDFVELAAHETLHGEDGVLRVRHGLAFRGLADEAFAVLGESDDGRSRVGAFRVGDDLEGVAVHDGHAAVGGAEVNTENLAHSNCPFL